MRVAIFICIGVLVTFTSRVALADDDLCSDVLKIPLQEHLHIRTDDSFASTFHQLITSNVFKTRTDDAGGNISGNFLDILKINVGGQSSSTAKDIVRNLQNTESSISQTQKEEVVKTYLSSFAGDAILAWSRCVNDKRKMRQGSQNGIGARIRNFDPDDGSFVLALSWHSVHPNQAVPKVSKISFPGVTCDDLPRQSQRVPEDSEVRCQRQNIAGATLVFNTDQGPLSPAVVIPSKLPICDENCDACRWRNATAECTACSARIASDESDWIPVPLRTPSLVTQCRLTPDTGVTAFVQGRERTFLGSEGFRGGHTPGYQWFSSIALRTAQAVDDVTAKEASFGGQTTGAPERKFQIELAGTRTSKDGEVSAWVLINSCQRWPAESGACELSGDTRLKIIALPKAR